MSRGFFGAVVYHPKTETNVGSLHRSARLMGAAFLGQIGPRYKRQSSDTLACYRHMPLYEYLTFEDFYDHLPFDCVLVGVEMDERAKPLVGYRHPQRAVYLFGAEDSGLPEWVLVRCHELVQLGTGSLNLACAGSIILYDRMRYTNRLGKLETVRKEGSQ